MYEEYYKKAILFFITEEIHFPRNAHNVISKFKSSIFW